MKKNLLNSKFTSVCQTPPTNSENVMDERNYDRFVVDKEIECFFGERRDFVLLYDLSVGGCMIEAPKSGIKGGTSIHLKLNDFIEAYGRVVWEKDGCAGVSFGHALHEAAVKLLGFSPTATAFEQMEPRDRFGRPLPALPRY